MPVFGHMCIRGCLGLHCGAMYAARNPPHAHPQNPGRGHTVAGVFLPPWHVCAPAHTSRVNCALLYCPLCGFFGFHLLCSASIQIRVHSSSQSPRLQVAADVVARHDRLCLRTSAGMGGHVWHSALRIGGGICAPDETKDMYASDCNDPSL